MTAQNLRIASAADVARRLQPVVVGGDILAYSYVRELHRAYGVERTIVLATQDIKMLSSSRFTDYRLEPLIHDPEDLYDALERVAAEVRAADPERVLLVLGCDDCHARMLSSSKPRLEAAGYTVPYLDFALLDDITQKRRFYELCEELDVPYPKARYFDCSENGPEKLPVDEFSGEEREAGDEVGMLSRHFSHMAREIDGLIQTDYTNRILLREAQLKALEAQINPHFLYNTLECIRSEALLYECDSIARMAKALAAFFRYSISNKENIVTIRDELRNIENYFLIQSYRFENKFALEINVEDDREEVGNYLIPKLSLQPIVENAIFHGLETKAENGKVTIRIYTTDQELVVVISDNGTGIDWDTLVSMRQALEQTEERRESGDDGSTHGETAGMDAHGTDRNEKRGNGIALSNVNQRIQLAFGNRYGLRLYSTTGIGTDVEIWLPKKVDRNDL